MPPINLALHTMSDLRAALPHGRRLIGLDPGSKTIGVALSDATLLLASPWGALKRTKLAAAAATIRELAAKEQAAGLVVGLPLSMDGTFGPAAQAARDWALALSEATALPTAMWDERLSTAAVTRMLVAADVSRARRAAIVDGLAAAYTLQSALDATRTPPRPESSQSALTPSRFTGSG